MHGNPELRALLPRGRRRAIAAALLAIMPSAIVAGCGDRTPAGSVDAGAALVEDAAAPVDAGAGDAGAGATAPPTPAPAATPEQPTPEPPSLRCPRGMMRVAERFCVDKWEASLVDKGTQIPLSPYYPPDRRLAIRLAETWEQARFERGSPKAQAMPLPPLPKWQMEHDPEPVAVSRPGVKPNGYISGVVAERACRNAGKRLCRIDEWKTACMGEARRKYPYGDAYVGGACNIFRAVHPAGYLHGDPSIGHFDPRLNLVAEENGDPLLRPTGATPRCRSEWEGDAAFDMNGNLDEWVEDEHGRFVGGFFSRSKRDGCESSVSSHDKTYADYSTGARCCWSPGDPDAAGADGEGLDRAR